MTSESKTIRARIFIVLLGGVLTMAGFYLYFVQATVSDIVARGQNLRQIKELSFGRESLEEKYFKLSDGLDFRSTSLLGFVNQKQGDVIARQTSFAKR